MARGRQAEKKRSSKKQPVEFVTLESEGEEPVYEVERIVDSRYNVHFIHNCNVNNTTLI